MGEMGRDCLLDPAIAFELASQLGLGRLVVLKAMRGLRASTREALTMRATNSVR